jgi:hypothetical protein
LIYIERTITINESSAFIEAPIVLYKGDRNIEIQFSIKNSPFKHKAGIDLTYGQLVIKRPKTNPIFSEVAKISSGKVLFTITDDMIDEFTELGDYDFQIRLLNSDLSSRATLPPVSAGIRVIEPLCEESVNSAPVNYSRAAIDREVEGTFDEEGNYNKTDWGNGDIITDKKLNKIEDAIYTVNDSKATKDDIPTDVSAFTNDAGYINDISHLAAKDELPTNVSELTNDAGYLTEHQSLEAYALKTDIPSTDGLATEQYVNDAVANVDVDLTGYATEIYVNDAISNMSEEIPTVSGSKTVMYQLHTAFDTEGFYYLSGFSVNCVDPFDGTPMGSISLEDGLYYGKAYTGYDGLTGSKEVVKVSLYSYTTHTSYEFEEYMDPHTNSPSGKITLFVTPSVFVNQSDLTGYATEAYVQDAVNNIEIPEGGGDIDLSNYVTKDEIIGTISGSISVDIVDTSLTSKLPAGLHLFKGVLISCKKTETDFFPTLLALDDDIVRVSHYEDTSLPNPDGTYGIATELYCYGSSTTYKFYVKEGTSLNNIILLSQESNYATEAYVQDAVDAIEIPDLSNYATKDEVIGTISGTISSSSTDTSLTSKLPAGLHLFKGVSIQYSISEAMNFPTSLALDDDIVRVSHYDDTEGNRGTITELYCYGSSTTYKFYVKRGSSINANSVFIVLLSQESNTTDLSGYATKDELNTALGDIESLLGGI